MSDPFLTTTLRVPLADIVIRETWQVRERINATAVKRYAAIYDAGTAMEPIRVAEVASASCASGVLMLIDGAHRVAALRSLGATHADASVEPMKEQQAQWAAASANLEHGMPLKAAELREVFRQYIATGQHRKGRRFKSFADIAKDIPGKTRYTYRNWMREDFPETFRKHYAGSNGEGHSHGGLDHVGGDQQALDMAAIEEHLRQVAALARSMPSKATRGRIAALVEATRAEVLK